MGLKFWHLYHVWPILVTLKSPIAAIGREVLLDFTRHLGRLFLFFMWGFVLIFHLPLQFAKFVSQVYFIGARSVLVICLTGAFTGMVLGLQGYYTLVKFGAQGMLGAAVALSLIRELGPVLTAIMITARAGSAMSAEIGIMRISEEIDALKTMDINPIRFLVSPRIVAALISFPLLTAIFDVIGIFGGLRLRVGPARPELRHLLLPRRVERRDAGRHRRVRQVGRLRAGGRDDQLLQGYYTHTRAEGFGAKGVSSSTTSAVVICCVLILVTDYVMTSFLL